MASSLGIARENHYPSLEIEIARLKSFAKPLEKEKTVTPLMPVIARIMNLRDDFDELSPEDVIRIEEEVKECGRLLAEISYEYVNDIISKPEPSKVFKILANANKFEKALKSKVGKPLKLADGTETVLTPAIVECLTKYRFSLGTPPTTPQGIETLESILFGGTLADIYAFRDLVNVDKGVFDRFLGSVDRLVEQSTHYTTANEKDDFEGKAKEFRDLKGLRGLSKATITGSADSVVRLMKDYLLSKHGNGSMPLKGVDGEKYELDENLIKAMTDDKSSIFVVRISSVTHNVLTKDVLKEKWNGLMGRLVVIDESENAQRSGTTFVYSQHPRISDALAQFHVKDSGTPASTQMNLRLMMENFKESDLQTLETSIDGKIAQLEAEGVDKKSGNGVRKQEWVFTAQKDYLALKKFRRFLKFVKQMKTASPEELKILGQKLAAETADQSMDYFFKNLIGKGYECIAVPQGGGRRELGHPGRFYLEKSKHNLEGFKGKKLEDCRKKLATLRAARQIPSHSTEAETSALARAMAQRQGPNALLHEESTGDSVIVAEAREAIGDALHNAEIKGEKLIETIISKIDEVLGINLPGYLKAMFTKTLREWGVESAAKILERGKFREAANKLRAFAGRTHRTAVSVTESALRPLNAMRRKLEPSSIDTVESMLNDIEGGSFQPSLALAEMSWTIDDVLIENEFPSKNYIHIGMTPEGQLDPSSLEKHLESKQKALADFPELFELYCSNILLYLNDPHNPTSQVASYEVKLKLLDIASKYKLTILSDEPYHKQVSKDVKDRQGDVSFAEFYEQHNAGGKGRFPNEVTIYTALSTTKWAMGAGRRTGVLLTNDTSRNHRGQNLAESVAENTDSVNIVSLYMDRETLQTGLQVKNVCKALEKTTIFENPIKAIDAILAKDFIDPTSENFSMPIYDLLIEARNDLERLEVRGARGKDYKHYMDSVITKLKGLRLDKKTQKDSANRGKAAVAAIRNLSGEFPGLEKRFIHPQGPFYCCVQLDTTGNDSDLQPFLETIAKARKIDVVPLAKGYVRFAFGGSLEGTVKGYELLTLAIETDLRLLLQYWKEFQEKRDSLNESQDLDPSYNALKSIFPGGETELIKTLQEKKVLIDKLQSLPSARRRKLTNRFSATDSQYLASIEPESPATIVTIRGVKCKDTKDFVDSDPFQDLFNHYLLKAKVSIPELEQMDNKSILKDYGADRFAEVFKSRSFSEVRQGLFEEIAVKVANLWFAADNIKILGLEFPSGLSEQNKSDALLGAEKRIGEFIKEFTLVFAPNRQGEINFQPSFQVGYEAINDVKADTSLPQYQQNIINKSTFVGQTSPTDPSAKIVTPGKARVAGHDRGIYRRDGDGKKAPPPEFFRKRFNEFSEVMNKKDYVCKMVQIGPTRTMLVMHKSFSHYLIEELRLLPQDVSLDDVETLKPDAISFLGVPTKTVGKDYRIGYFMDEKCPVSWVNAEDIADYMGYLKKPILTMANERVKAIGGLPIHGAAFTVKMKNGLRKTIVLAGDSGTGKSETLISMRQQIYDQIGGAQNVEDIELLSGDMLSLWMGDDGQVYMMGTESGDFMRLTDIGEGWQKVNQDLIHKASKTNLEDPTNPRATIPGLCDPNIFLKPVRVNMFFYINNFEKPNGAPFQEEPNPENLLLQAYTKGYRREKGTSGDQPNVFASILHSKSTKKDFLLTKYREQFDDLLGWDLTLAKSGKVKQATLSFNEVRGKAPRAKRMVNDLFKGETLDITSTVQLTKQYLAKAIQKGNVSGLKSFITKKLGTPEKDDFYYPLYTMLMDATKELQSMQSRGASGEEYDKFIDEWEEKLPSPQPSTGVVMLHVMRMKEQGATEEECKTYMAKQLARPSSEFTISKINYKVLENRFYAVVQDKNGQSREVKLDRSIFDQIYNPIASTYCGNPFIDPRGMAEILSRFGKGMKDAGIITGTLYTQLAVDGEQFSGPARASQSILEFIDNDKRINKRFQGHKRKVIGSLTEKYGNTIFGQADLPQQLERFNLWYLERQESMRARLVDSGGETIQLKTQYYENGKYDREAKFNPSLLTPDIGRAIHRVTNNADAKNINTEAVPFKPSDFAHIKTADSKEELIYQILLANGVMRLGDKANITALWKDEVMAANEIAKAIMKANPGIINTPADLPAEAA